MKKQRRKPQSRGKAAAVAAPQVENQGRRRFLRILRNGAISVPIVGVAGVVSVRSVQATIAEGDLSRIGNGRPTIVQIHDPQCQLCQTLQKQTRRALKPYDADSYTFLVADITTLAGQSLSSRYGVPHVTLLMFDPRGEMVNILRGPVETKALEASVAGHLARYGVS